MKCSSCKAQIRGGPQAAYLASDHRPRTSGRNGQASLRRASRLTNGEAFAQGEDRIARKRAVNAALQMPRLTSVRRCESLQAIRTSKRNSAYPLACGLDQISGRVERQKHNTRLSGREILPGASLKALIDARLLNRAFPQSSKFSKEAN